jgi:alpha-galactosidase
MTKTKITFIGAGSTVFAKNLLGDLLTFPELADARISLHDIDEARLQTTTALAHRLATLLEVHPQIEATTDLRAALDGADYVFTMFQVGGYKPATVVDFEVPKRYGLRQTIADTLGVGGIMRGLRTIPVLLEICGVMEELCPEALLLNYVNPMAMLCWAVARASTIKMVGLCHSVQGTAEQLARDLEVPPEELNYLCAGINHMAFYLRFERYLPDGTVEDLYPRLHEVVREGRVPDWNRVRYEMLERLGYFVTESSEHFAEYVPWFIKRDRPDLVERFNIPLDEYITRCEVQIKGWEFLQAEIEEPGSVDRQALAAAMRAEGYSDFIVEQMNHALDGLHTVTRSPEYGSRIVHSLETGQPRVVYGNVPNRGLIDNLPAGCIVEVPSLVDRNGVQPTRVGSLPPHLAALMQTNINVQALTVEAALTGEREHIYHAAMLDPHTAAELDLDAIWQLVDDLIAAHGDWLPDYT